MRLRTVPRGFLGAVLRELLQVFLRRFPWFPLAFGEYSGTMVPMSIATALAVVPDTEDNSSNDTEPGIDPARKSDRQQVSLARGLRDLVAAERDRIEGALPEHRRRSIEHYSDLIMRLGLREIANVQPVIDPLAELGL